MVLPVWEEEIVSKLKDSMRHSIDFDDTCYYMDVVDYLIFLLHVELMDEG